MGERPLVGAQGVLGDLPVARGDQIESERAEEWGLPRFLTHLPATARGRHPDAASHVGEDVCQLLVGLRPSPAILSRAKSDVPPLARGAEAQREGLTAFAVQLHNLPD